MACFISLSFLFVFLLCPLLSLSTNSEGNGLHALRRRLSESNNVLLSWDPTLVNPCSWFHVTRDSNNDVIRLDLGNSNVCGTLVPELGHLQHPPVPSTLSTLKFGLASWIRLDGANGILNADTLVLPTPDERPEYAYIRAILQGRYLLGGHTSGDDWDLKAGANHAYWITHIPASYNSQLVSILQEFKKMNFCFGKFKPMTYDAKIA